MVGGGEAEGIGGRWGYERFTLACGKEREGKKFECQSSYTERDCMMGPSNTSECPYRHIAWEDRSTGKHLFLHSRCKTSLSLSTALSNSRLSLFLSMIICPQLVVSSNPNLSMFTISNACARVRGLFGSEREEVEVD